MTVFVMPTVPAAEPAGDDSIRTPQAGVPRGSIRDGSFSTSTIFPGTERDYAVYVPAQYQDGMPARLMVFQDGKNYAKSDGSFRVPVLLDNLIHRGELPVTVAVFVNPGVIPPKRPGAKARSNRSFEYDSLGDRYVRFLIDEFLPVATKGLTISDQPADLRFHRGLGAARSVRPRAQPDRQLHQHSRGVGLSRADPPDEGQRQANSDLSAGGP
jgi:enterochelin esterase family protein